MGVEVEIDQFYKQNLTEWIYDEQKLISYRYLSVTLGVHVNLAKQMLYEFYNDELRKQKQKKKESSNNSGAVIQALYYISGLKRSTSAAGDATLSFSSTICRDDQVESVKSEFKTISSVHIYSIQALQPETSIIDKLSTAMQETCLLKDDEGRSAVEFGPFKVKKPSKIHVAPQIPESKPSTSSVATSVKPKPSEKKQDVKQSFFGNSKSSEKQTKKKEDEKAEDSEKPKEKPAHAGSGTGLTSKPRETSTKSNSGNQSDRLKNMFAAAASKPKKPVAVKEEVKEEEMESEDEDFMPTRATQKKTPAKTYGKNNAKNKPKPKPKEVETNRKRKRVMDILSSSEEEEEEETRTTKKPNRISTDEEDSLPESPIPRKRAPRIASDSESEELFPPTPEPKKGKLNFAAKAKSPPPPELSNGGKKHIRKTVTKSYVDEEGFTVTKKEQVWVSASESEPEVEEVKTERTKSKPDISSESTVNEKEKRKQFSSPVIGNKRVASVPPVPNKKPAKTPPTQNPGGPKTKQSSLMSFFTKKA